MEEKLITNCRGHFKNISMKYKNIQNGICLQRFEWSHFTQEELIISEEIIHFLYDKLTNKKIFLFVLETYSYPLDFKIKRFGLWKNTEFYKSSKWKNSTETETRLNQKLLIFGSCQIEKEQIDKELILYIMQHQESCLIFTNDFKIDEESFIEITDSSYTLNYSNLINEYCSKGGIIVGGQEYYEGPTLEIFYKIKE